MSSSPGADAQLQRQPQPQDDPTNTNAVPGPSTYYTFPDQPPPPPPPIIVPTTIDPSTGLRVVPRLFEFCQVDDLITLIASMLGRLITHNDRIPLTPTSLTRFHSRAPPAISVRDYLLRIARYTNVEPVCLLILLHYVDKVCTRLPTFTISSLTVHRFVIAAVSVGSKALSDSFCTNGRYARVGGIGVTEMNLLEKEFCEAIDWRLTTTGSVLSHYYTSLVGSHPAYMLIPTPPTSPATTSSMEMDEDHEISHNFVDGRASPALVPTGSNRRRGEANRSNLPSPVRPPHLAVTDGTTAQEMQVDLDQIANGIVTSSSSAVPIVKSNIYYPSSPLSSSIASPSPSLSPSAPSSPKLIIKRRSQQNQKHFGLKSGGGSDLGNNNVINGGGSPEIVAGGMDTRGRRRGAVD